ncbi:MAG: hypothetical protein ACP5OZ_00125 [Candidatus Woesearchaeota archaeon]
MKFGLFKKESKKAEQKKSEKPGETQLKDKKEAILQEQFPAFQKGSLETMNIESKSPFEQHFEQDNLGIAKTENKVLNEMQQKPQTISITPSLNQDIQIGFGTQEQQYKSQESTAPLFSDTIIPPPKVSDLPKNSNANEKEFEYKDYSKDYFNIHRIEPIILKPDEEYAETSFMKTSERQKTRELFLNINDYKEILQEIKNLKLIIESTNYYLEYAEEQDKKEEKILNELRVRLEDIERKILLIDKIIFEK